MDKKLNPLEDMVGELFVNRYEEFDFFLNWATRIYNPANGSVALIGRRRTGKTAILVKLFNHLFYEQKKVLPIYISFARYASRQKVITSYEFAREYLTGYMGSYLAFFYQRPDLLRARSSLEDWRRFAEEVGDEYALEWYRQYELYKTADIPHMQGKQ